jgi:hypothetical protein
MLQKKSLPEVGLEIKLVEGVVTIVAVQDRPLQLRLHLPGADSRSTTPRLLLWQPAQENTVLSPKPIHFGH